MRVRPCRGLGSEVPFGRGDAVRLLGLDEGTVGRHAEHVGGTVGFENCCGRAALFSYDERLEGPHIRPLIPSSETGGGGGSAAGFSRPEATLSDPSSLLVAKQV